MNTAIFNDPACFVSTITVAALRKLGIESLDWSPEVLRDAFDEGYSVKLGQKAFDKLNCGYMMLGSTMYSDTIEGFLTANAVMGGKPLDGSEISYNSLRDIAWGVWEYINLTGEEENNVPTETFAPEIILYIQRLGQSQGITQLPKWLEFVPPESAYSARLDETLSGDVVLFEAYSKRQKKASEDLSLYTKNRQSELVKQLKTL